MVNPLLTRFELSLAGLPQIIGWATPVVFRRRSLPDKWSAHENFAHLAHFTLVTQERMARILREEAPLIERLRPDHEPALLRRVRRI
ncbi:hypothetical protein [Meiothermus rufus]|uniref:hypothetical protein n=1 Tax=Meiothermus rufus TaxID=604332 RepID=UPI001FDF6E52|nr:hypothetical protein [Meiothermus rufus]